MQSITKMQIRTMDHMMDAWEEQIKSPNPMTGSPSAMLSKLKSSPSGSPAGSWPDAGAFQLAAANPLQFWMQFAKQWQKACADACRFGPRPAYRWFPSIVKAMTTIRPETLMRWHRAGFRRKTLPFIGRLSGSAPSHRDRFSVAFITNIVESRFSARTAPEQEQFAGRAYRAALTAIKDHFAAAEMTDAVIGDLIRHIEIVEPALSRSRWTIPKVSA
jgi:hypothetical protein